MQTYSWAVNAIAKVEPLTTARALRGPFDYKIPESMQGTIEVGSILMVPFARRRILGVVTDMASTSQVPPEKLAEPFKALGAGVPPALVELGLWVADAYCSTPARGLALVTPPGTGTGQAKNTMAAKTVLVAQVNEAGAAALTDETAKLTDAQRAALVALAEHPDGVPTASAKDLIGSTTQSLRRLEARGLLTIDDKESRRVPIHQSVGALVERPPLTNDQADALAEIIKAIDTGFADLLLHGVTGSGKTEVYLGAAEAAVQAGKSVIVMVPEIALTPQVVTRFAARFKDRVAVMHSQLTPGQRHDEWLRIRRGEADIVVGPRSAVFAPVKDLGLLIVDEEHDASYKQDGDPRYDARDVALRRSRMEDATLLSGSATPRAEGWERSHHINLPQRVDGSPLPPVELLDMNGERGALHPKTSSALAAVASKGEKAIVLLNRRGWSNFLSCQDCGHSWICPNCDVTLVLHMAQSEMRCHHCGHRERVPELCPECDSVSISRHGTGTERLQHELRDAIGHAVEIHRLDADTAARHGVSNVLRQFERASSGILVGTQMVAKGHDFPDVTLGVVIDADSTLNFPDFRAEERTFALVAQLGGRSGRGGTEGRVLVQTRSPETRALKYASSHDSEGFVKEELERREAFGYPPFGHLVKIQTSSEDLARAQTAADHLAKAISINGARVLGPTGLFKRKGLERYQLEVKTYDRDTTVTAVREAVELVSGGAAGRNVKFAVDVDPQ
ncbi:MAG: primosomal protein N' [Solirubrobacterales bacterium]|nr:primosomal protein N' [Solirubrobacterales bacterium]